MSSIYKVHTCMHVQLVAGLSTTRIEAGQVSTRERARERRACTGMFLASSLPIYLCLVQPTHATSPKLARGSRKQQPPYAWLIYFPARGRRGAQPWCSVPARAPRPPGTVPRCAPLSTAPRRNVRRIARRNVRTPTHTASARSIHRSTYGSTTHSGWIRFSCA